MKSTTTNLIDILRYVRKHDSKGEAKFINDYLLPKINGLGYSPEMDMAGNIWVETAPKEQSPFLFVSHIDTCHQRDDGTLTTVIENNIAKLSSNDVNHGCLGADDGVGIYCNLKMMEAGVAGTYLFTRGEEKGGIGAGHIAKKETHRLEGFLMSVEVDRQGTDEIIISQCYGECASEDYANDLAKAIGMGHHASYMGVYTDVSEFAEVIPENVNISAGYENQHTVKENVNLLYVDQLVEKLIKVDWSSLRIVREPGDFGEQEVGWWNWQQGAGSSSTSLSDFDKLNSYVADNPERVAFFLESMGVEQWEIEQAWNNGYDESPFDEGDLAVGMY